MRAPNPFPARAARPALRAAALALLLAATPAAAIVGGREGAEVPGAASVVMVLTSGGGVCSGIVVAPDAVLTAGHCVAGVGENRVHFRDETGRPVLIETAARSLHPAYDGDAVRGRTRSIDLALLRTRELLPARFAPAALSAAMPRAGESLTLAGYGAVRGGDRRSIGRYRGAALTVVEPYGPSRILVWMQAKGAGGCQGDSGGPILDGAAVVAVAAWVKDACGGLTQGILLGPQRDWIDRTLAGWRTSARWSHP
ncbi:peptidase S1/S6 chymotrypsin [Methylorubrum populi]|uniref:Peptidase S1/S6 chymotrypsin n=1 Tax=Methylorubrum populi TaxID=223967 RepID=A0A160PCD9_9HYPH|nr:trypsin-like serine protease [Methylorubrum populi]BAU90066.1 peptidase S1/S6 chymotrypsin [Methylorubrum populi]